MVLEKNELFFNHFSIEMKIGDVRKYRANGVLLYKTSLIQDGMTGYFVKVDKNLRIICWSDFERICREYRYRGFTFYLHFTEKDMKNKLYNVPHVIKA